MSDGNIGISKKSVRIIWFMAGIVSFGGLMAWRGELESIWLRSLVAAMGAIILMLCFGKCRK